MEFVHSYETARGFGTSMLREDHSHSMRRLQDSITSRLVNAAEVKALIERAYKPSLKLLSYVISDDGQEINILSHAAIGWQSLEALATRLGVPYMHSTTVELAATIDRINTVFASLRDRDEVHTLYTEAAMLASYWEFPLSPVSNPVEFILWGRKYTNDVVDRTSAGHGYKVSFTHGHDSKDPLPEGAYCVDSKIGKDHTNLAGPYNVLVTKGIPSPKALSTPTEAPDIGSSYGPWDVYRWCCRRCWCCRSNTTHGPRGRWSRVGIRHVEHSETSPECQEALRYARDDGCFFQYLPPRRSWATSALDDVLPTSRPKRSIVIFRVTIIRMSKIH